MGEEEIAIVKGGVCWLEFAISRANEGLMIYVKSVPELEAFMKGLGDGRTDSIEMYGRDWFAPRGELKFYRMDKVINGKGVGYSFSKVAEPLEDGVKGTLNLSFLRVVGISDPEGVRFVVKGPFSKLYMKALSDRIVKESKSFIQEFITPVNINLRISSQDI